jgi:uncharacterized protein (DUF1800 family)
VSGLDPQIRPVPLADYMDLLAKNADGNFRTLLEAVTRSPVMGTYLTYREGKKGNPAKGQFPDENYAREVMQLFTIGLNELNIDGSARMVGGRPVETYTSADVSGLAKVFTGLNWDCTDRSNSCFQFQDQGTSIPSRSYELKPMVFYPQFHSTLEKKFLGTVVPDQGSKPDPEASLKIALDTLFNHPNVGPFFGKMLIQRLVTSNPSPKYVADVAGKFNNNGNGVRGDMKAVIKEILTNPEAGVISNTSGQLRDPILRVAAILRAFDYKSTTGWFRMGNTDRQDISLGMSPLRAPSVFNFFRPGFSPTGKIGDAGFVAPEMQIINDTSVAGYTNYVRDGVLNGFGPTKSTFVNDNVQYKDADMQPNFTAELALADKPSELVERVNIKLLQGRMSKALRDEIVGAVSKQTIPVLTPDGKNLASVDAAKRARVNAAVFLVATAPEFQVMK